MQGKKIRQERNKDKIRQGVKEKGGDRKRRVRSLLLCWFQVTENMPGASSN